VRSRCGGHATRETTPDLPADDAAWRGWRSWLAFAGVAVCVGLAGLALAETAVELSRKTGPSQTTIGAVFTAITTSLPELVTSIAAVRQGALTLAVGGIIGGNAFDVLFLAFADIAYPAARSTMRCWSATCSCWRFRSP
jgi:cation:H+ antiporter